MTDITIPAPVAESPVTTPIPAGAADNAPKSAGDDDTIPRVEKPAGETEQDASGAEKPEAKEELTQGELKRRERNKERWQQMKETARRAESAEAELYRLKYTKQPDFSQIEDPSDELAERTAWKVKQSNAEEQVVRARQDRVSSLAQSWNETTESMREKIPDFDAVVTERTPIHARAAQHIIESEKGGDIAYYLGKNPDAARSLYDKFESSPAQAFIELGRIEARLSAPKAKTVSTAPKPASTLNGGSNPMAFDPDKSSITDMQAYLRKSGVIR